MRKYLLCILLAISASVVCIAARAQDTKVRIRTVVIDPGHGGTDSGCISKDGKTYEKNLTLSIAKLFGNKIRAEYPDINVVYTRTTDKSVALKDRAEIANRNKADLFVSIHINSVASTSPSGTSAHVLGASSNKNRDLFSDNMDLCRRENSVILLEEDYSTSYQGFNPNDPESYIIFSLLQNAHLSSSLHFASLVQENMSRGPIKKNRGISQDPFYVLYRTTMPSVLLELGFISNSSDLSVLRSKSGQAALADRIFSAFREYKDIYEESGVVSAESAGSAGDTVNGTEQVSSGVRYGVQIFALSRKLPSGDPAMKGVRCEVFRSGGMYKYVGGVSCSAEAAEAFRKKISGKFPGCYVVRIENGTVTAVR